MVRYRYETTLSFNPDRADFTEVDVGVSFEVSFGRLAQGPSYACGGVPADPDEITDIRLETVGGRKAPWNLHFHSDKHFAALVVEMLEASEHHLSAMIEAAHEEEVAVEDEISEARWEERREGFAA
jgi:hypothetical protein